MMRPARLFCFVWAGAVALSLVMYAAAAEETPVPVSAPAPSEALPEEIRPLVSLLDQETKALEILRKFDQTQMKLIEWDISLAEELFANDGKEAAEAKLEEARKRVELVKKAYDLFLARYPNNARANCYLGELYYDHLDDQAQGLAKWKLAEQLDPNTAAALNNMAIHYSHTGDFDQGITYLERAIKLEPDNPDFLYNAVQIYLTQFPQVMQRYNWDKKRTYHEAMKRSRKAAELSPDDYALAQDYAVNFFIAEQMEAQADWKAAMDAWAKAREIAQRKVDEYYTFVNEGRAAIRGGYYERAISCLKNAKTMNARSSEVDALIGQAEQGASEQKKR